MLFWENLFGFSFLCTPFSEKSIVLTKVTLVNRPLTPKDIISSPEGIISSLSLFIKSSVFKTLYSDLFNGVKSLFKYLTISKVAVAILDVIGDL